MKWNVPIEAETEAGERLTFEAVVQADTMAGAVDAADTLLQKLGVDVVAAGEELG